MGKSELQEIKKDKVGTGLLIENDGYISMSDSHNRKLKESIEDSSEWYCPRPFVVHAVFQKYGIKNANGRVYPENILKREVAKYQERINEKRALGECYKPDVEVLTEEGWKRLDQIQFGERVLTLNTETSLVEINPVLRVISKIHRGDVIRLKGYFIDEIVTPNHGFPVFYEDKTFNGFYTAKELLDKRVKAFETSFIPKIDNVNVEEETYTPSEDKELYLTKEEAIPLKDIEFSVENYSGEVMCIEVKNHTFYVRSNGKAHWSKNCNHPQESTIDLGRVSHNITELHWEGSTLVGQMELNISKGFAEQGICSTLGDTVANLLMNGYKIGVSSRGVGSVEQKMGTYMVGDDFELICWDVVSDPSTPQAYIGSSQEELSAYVEQKQEKRSPITEKINKIKRILG